MVEEMEIGGRACFWKGDVMAKRRKKSSGGWPAKGRLRDIADDLWSWAVRLDWAGKCAVCGAPSCEAHHMVPRQFEATRYDLWCGIALCPNHHKFDPGMAPHQNPKGFIVWLEVNLPSRAEWLDQHYCPRFNGIKDVAHYLAQIKRLEQYVEPDDFVRIVGVKLSSRLGEVE